MAWTDRIREAAYTAPSGTRIVFGYEDVRRETEKKTTGFEFPDADGTLVQDLGHSGRRYPLRVFFWGTDYDTIAEAFEGALLERGTGRLEHPLYGAVDVVPFGTISRRDDLKTAANQAVIEVTFWETIGAIYPEAQTDPASAVLVAVSDFNVAMAGAFEAGAETNDATSRVTLRSQYLALLDDVEAGLQKIAATQDDTRHQFALVVDSINRGIDILVADPLTLAAQTAVLIQAPARAAAAITAQLEAYQNLAATIFGANGLADVNALFLTDLFVSTYLSAQVVAVVNNEFETKPDAIAAAESLLVQLEAVATWRDDQFGALGVIDTGGAYQQLQDAVSLAAGFLVEISFSLKQEHRITLDRNRALNELEAELYGTVDENLDFLIESNSLTGSEILELPKGRAIVYYI